MKGIVFNLLEQVVVAEHGEDVWDDLIDEVGVSGAYSSLGSYDDADWMALVAAAGLRSDLEKDDAVRRFGARAMPLMAARYPHFFAPHATTRDFLLTLNDVIHPEVRKIYPGADAPDFEFANGTDGTLVLGYASPRRLCSLAEGFIEGAAPQFGERAEIHQPTCMKHGAETCQIVVKTYR